MPPAPSRKLIVSPLRRRVDIALLRGIGRTEGQASAIVGETYESYARWRADVEDVELLMRQNRRQMSRSGQSRTTRPADQVGRRVWEELQGIVPLYPSGLLTRADVVDGVNVPRGTDIPKSEPLFNAGVVHDQGGRAFDLGAFGRVRYVGMLRAIGFDSPFGVPQNTPRAEAIADWFERDRRVFVAEARHRAASYVSGDDVISEAAQVAERHWLHACRAAGMRPVDVGTEADLPHLASTLVTPVAGRATNRRRRN